MINLYAVNSFLSYSRKKKDPGLYLQEAENILALNLQLFCQEIQKKKLPTGKMNCLIYFFIDVVIKLAVLVN